MKLIAESKIENAKLLTEAYDPNKPQTLKLRGVFMQAEQKNENSRVYQIEELVKETQRFKTEMIDTGRALAELEHPESIQINPERVCARITDLTQEGNDFIGEAVVLMTDEKHGIKGTPQGDILASLLQHGTNVGFSSRGVGDVEESGLVKNFQLVTIDTVLAPSIGIMSKSNGNRFVNGILESKEFVINAHGEILEKTYDNFEKNISKLPLKESERNIKIVEAINNFFKSLKMI